MPACVEPAVIHPPVDASRLRIDRVLCAVTFSPSARRVVTWAASLAGASDGDIRLFHVSPDPGEDESEAREADAERLLRKLFALDIVENSRTIRCQWPDIS